LDFNSWRVFEFPPILDHHVLSDLAGNHSGNIYDFQLSCWPQRINFGGRLVDKISTKYPPNIHQISTKNLKVGTKMTFEQKSVTTVKFYGSNVQSKKLTFF
jgi:hypothetical protein